MDVRSKHKVEESAGRSIETGVEIGTGNVIGSMSTVEA